MRIAVPMGGPQPHRHPSGTYWYHVHKHGSVTYQFNGGMAGFLIVKGGKGTLDAVPEVRRILRKIRERERAELFRLLMNEDDFAVTC